MCYVIVIYLIGTKTSLVGFGDASRICSVCSGLLPRLWTCSHTCIYVCMFVSVVE